MNAADLKPAQYNPRKISKARLDALERSMREFGDMSGIVFNRKTGRLVGGHQRVKNLQSAWPVVKQPAKDKTGTVAVGYVDTPDGRWSYREVDWTEAKEKAANVAANAHGGEFDRDLLAPIIRDLQLASFDLKLLGIDPRPLNLLLEVAGDDRADADVATSPEPVTKRGNVWQLGDHRVMCGDSREPKDVARLMQKGRAPCMWTDPPYGVSYQGGGRSKLRIKNDEAAGIESLLTGAFAAANKVLLPGAAVYVARPAGALAVTFGRCFLAAGWRLHEELIWKKDALVLGHSDYHLIHETIMYGYAPGEGRFGRGGKGWYGPDNAVSVFEVPRPKRSESHPTMKPVALVQVMLANSTKSGDLVYEPFGGSGTTLMAAQVLGRTCYAMEIDPKYVDVAVARWEQFTGKKAVKA